MLKHVWMNFRGVIALSYSCRARENNRMALVGQPETESLVSYYNASSFKYQRSTASTALTGIIEFSLACDSKERRRSTYMTYANCCKSVAISTIFSIYAPAN